MVPLATNGAIGKITNGTIGRTRNRATIGLTNGTIGTTNGTIGTNVSTNGNICTNGTIGYRETFRVLWLPMVPLATNGTIGKISSGTMGRIPERTHDMRAFGILPMVPLVIFANIILIKTVLICEVYKFKV